MSAPKIVLAIQRKNKNDCIFTPPKVVDIMLKMCDIKEGQRVLDPSRGEGAFYNKFPDNCIKDYAEITENIDFFDKKERYDLIVGNPPYSLWTKWLDHTMTLTDKFCYIFGAFNVTDHRFRKIIENGFGITKMHLLKVDWWFSPSYIFLFEKGAKSILDVSTERILCEFCNKRCKRGREGYSSNRCAAIVEDQV